MGRNKANGQMEVPADDLGEYLLIERPRVAGRRPRPLNRPPCCVRPLSLAQKPIVFTTPWLRVTRDLRDSLLANANGVKLMPLDLDSQHRSFIQFLLELRAVITAKLALESPPLELRFPLQPVKSLNAEWDEAHVLLVRVDSARMHFIDDRVTHKATPLSAWLRGPCRVTLHLQNLVCISELGKAEPSFYVERIEADTVPRAAVNLLARGLDLCGIVLPGAIYYQIYLHLWQLV